MYIIDHMQRSPVTIKPELPIPEARELLRLHKFRHLPVTDELERLVGMITDRDLRSSYPSTFLTEEQQREVLSPLAATPVSTIMSRDFVFLSPCSTLDDALLLFDRQKVGSLPVLDDRNRVVGIFSIRDLMQSYKELFGLGEKGSFMIAVKPDGGPRPLSRLTQVLEDRAIRFTRLLHTTAKGKDGEEDIIYIRIHTFNINAVRSAVTKAGFRIHAPAATDKKSF